MPPSMTYKTMSLNTHVLFRSGIYIVKFAYGINLSYHKDIVLIIEGS